MPSIPNPVPDPDPARTARILLGVPEPDAPPRHGHQRCAELPDYGQHQREGRVPDINERSEQEVLFVGGTHDGIRMRIPNEARRVKLAVPDTSPVVETDYQRHVLVLQDRTRIIVFGAIGLSQDAILRELVRQYRRT